jgi:hypothetical protein
VKSAATDKLCFRLRVPMLFILWFVVLGTAAYGQGTASIVGTVTDATGAVVPNAKITITNLDQGFVRTTDTNTAGSYDAPELPIGRFQVQVEASGFKTYDRTDVTLNVNDTVRVDARLQVGTVGQSVTVQANALQVQADTSEVSHTVTGDDISNLATNGRNNIVQLTVLVPGAASQLPDFDSPGAQFQSHAVFFNGMRQDDNNWLIDGGEAYDRGGGGILLVAPSQEAIDEFKVETSNYAADLGNSSGGMTSMAIKSGTTKFHGSAWEFNRNDVLDAYSFLSKQSANPLKPELRYNLFGFNLGGPVEFKASKPKTFFFYNQEWRREINGGSIFNQVPTAANYSGNMTGLGTIYVPNTTDPAAIAKFAADGLTPGQAFPNDTIPANLIDPVAAAYVKAGYFQPPNASDGIHYFSSANTDTFYREEIARGDHQFNEKFSVMGHLIYDSLSQQVPTVAWSSNTFPTIGSLETVPSWAAVVHVTMALRPNLLNEAAFNHNGNNILIENTGLAKQPSGFSINPIFSAANTIDKIPGIEIKSPYNVTMDSNSWPWSNTWRSYQYKDDLSWTRGQHSFKFGAAWLWTKKVQEIFVNTAGTYQFNGQATAASTGGQGTPGVGLADFLLGDATQFSQAQLQDSVSISFNTIDLYGLDNWRVNKRLTLNLGLRWEGLPHAYDNNNRLSNFYPNLYNPADAAQFTSPTSGALNPNGPGFTTVSGIKLSSVPFYLNGVGLAGRNGIPRGLVQNHYLTFAPRLGFAYDVDGTGKTILRGGFGMFYERNAGNEEYNMGANVPFSNSGTTIYPYLDTTTTSWTTGVSAGQSPTTPQGFTGIQDRYPLTTVYQFSLGVQQQLRNNVVASIGYVGNTSSHLSQQADINTVPVNDPNRLLICGGNCGSPGGYNANYDRPYLGFGGGLNIVSNEGNAHYDGLQSSIRAQAWRNVTFGLSYTWSHTWDVVDGQLFNPLDDPMNPRYTYGTAGFDRRNIAAANFAYNLPIFQHSDGLGKTFLGGWTVSGIVLMQSGQPLTVDAANDNLGFGGSTTNHADQVGPVTYPHTFKQWFSPSAFAQPAALTWGSASKNSVKGPGRDNWNLSLYKDFRIHESVGFQFRAETFNTWNHTQFTGVNNSVLTGNSSTPYNSSAGTINATGDPRVFQLGGRIYF